MMSYRLGSAVGVALIWTLPAVCTHADADETLKDVIDHSQAVILAGMKDTQNPRFEGRFKALDPVFAGSFDLALLACHAVGGYRDRMTSAQRDHSVKDFAKFSVGNFANRFDDYSGQRFATLKEQETNRGDVIIFTAIDKPNGERVKINYILRKEDARWRVIDVFFAGSISELAAWRAEYTAAIRNQSVERLPAPIERRTADLANEK